MIERGNFYKQTENKSAYLYDKQELAVQLNAVFQHLNLNYGHIPQSVALIRDILVRADLSYRIPQVSNLVLIGGGSGTATVGRSLYSTGINSFTMLANTGEMGRDAETDLPLGGGMIFSEIPESVDCMDVLKQAIHATPSELRSATHKLLDQEKGLFMKLGYLIFEALRDLSNNPQTAIDFLNSWMQNPYRVIPSTVERTELYLSMGGEELGCNEYWLRDDPKIIADYPVMIPSATLSVHAREAIFSAKNLIIGPGDAFFSVLPHWGIKGFGEAIDENKDCTIILVANLTARERDITGFKLSDYLDLYRRFLPSNKKIIAVVNTGSISANDPLLDNLPNTDEYMDCSLVRADIASEEISGNKQLIHDETKLGQLLQTLITD